MFKFMFGGSEQSLKLLAKIQGVFSSVIAIVVFLALFNALSDTSVFAALVFGLAIAIIVWFALMISAWTLYSFADLVEYTKSTHEEIREMSTGLAEYTKANYKEVHDMSTGLTDYTKAMNKTLNGMGKNLYLIARHCYAEEPHGKTVRKETEKRG